MRRFTALLAALTLSLTLTSTTAISADAAASQAQTQAHLPGGYYTNGLWPDNQQINYGLDAGFTTDFNTRARITDAAVSWRNLTVTNPPKIYWLAPDDVEWGSYNVFQSGCKLRNSINVGGVFWTNLDFLGTSVAAATSTCSISGVIKTFSMAYDSSGPATGGNFWTGTTNPPTNRTDLWSAASHEMGHALGHLIHFSTGDVPCPASGVNRDTMCGSLVWGESYMRSPDDHDKHTFDSAY